MALLKQTPEKMFWKAGGDDSDYFEFSHVTMQDMTGEPVSMLLRFESQNKNWGMLRY